MSNTESSSTAVRRPLIGLTTYRQVTTWWSWERDAIVVPSSYVEMVSAAGGVPLLLPPVESATITTSQGLMVDHLDGLVLIGGGDLDAASYGETADPRNGGVNTLRDRLELELVRSALDADLPMLAICRGMQVLNVACGGTLVQYLPDQLGTSRHQPQAGEFGDVGIVTEPNSVARQVLGEQTEVRCSHHQAIDRLGNGLTVTARSDDGVIEAVEHRHKLFAVGVQWHPEEDQDHRLFTALIEASSRKELA